MSRNGIPRSISKRSSTEADTSAGIARARSTCRRSSALAKRRSCAAMRPILTRPACACCAIVCGAALSSLDGVHLNGPMEPRLPNNLNVRVDDVHGESLLKAIAGGRGGVVGRGVRDSERRAVARAARDGVERRRGARVDPVRSLAGSTPRRRSTRPLPSWVRRCRQLAKTPDARLNCLRCARITFRRRPACSWSSARSCRGCTSAMCRSAAFPTPRGCGFSASAASRSCWPASASGRARTHAIRCCSSGSRPSPSCFSAISGCRGRFAMRRGRRRRRARS